MERKSPIATSIQPKSIRAALLPTSWICAKVKTNGNIWRIKVGNNCVQNGPRKLLFLIGLKCLWREEKFRTKQKYSNTKSKTYIFLSCHCLEYFKRAGTFSSLIVWLKINKLIGNVPPIGNYKLKTREIQVSDCGEEKWTQIQRSRKLKRAHEIRLEESLSKFTGFCFNEIWLILQIFCEQIQLS